jgi:hypothetical protein
MASGAGLLGGTTGMIGAREQPAIYGTLPSTLEFFEFPLTRFDFLA